MRLRFFAILLAVLSVVTWGTITLHSIFLRAERLAFIDQQVRETAAALIDSELMDLRKIDFVRADEIISEELGQNRIGKFFVVRNSAGKVIFESLRPKSRPAEQIPLEPQWITLTSKGKLIRVLNLKLPSVPDRTLQVGLVSDEELLHPSYLSLSSAIFFACIISLGFLVSWFLASTLLKPIQRMERYVSELARGAVPGDSELPPVPKDLKKYAGSNPRDEFNRLLKGVDRMVDRINRTQKLSRFWGYQMAHELKTPLTILDVHVEQGVQKGAIPAEIGLAIKNETFRVSETVNSFLSWAELENSSKQRRLFANKLGRFALEIRDRLSPRVGDRIQCTIANDFHVLAAPQHIEQLLQNLVTNALTYSDESQPVHIEIKDPCLVVKDLGQGIPRDVLDRMGEPFNRTERSNGHGLGLAWVQSLARLYGWNVSIDTGPSGTTVTIEFQLSKETTV